MSRTGLNVLLVSCWMSTHPYGVSSIRTPSGRSRGSQGLSHETRRVEGWPGQVCTAVCPHGERCKLCFPAHSAPEEELGSPWWASVSCKGPVELAR